MLNILDDFPIHQTPEPLAYPSTSDRNFYDRTWFNGYSIDGDWYFGIGMAIYPHRGILDCAFSVVEKGGRQHSFFGSRRAPLERTEMQVGPFRIEVLEPMRRTRVVLDDNETGLSCDLTFSARSSPVQENRQTLWSGVRRIMDATRFDQFGGWSGEIRHPDGQIRVEEAECRGTKDRSWGMRGVGEPESGGAPPLVPPGIFFLWAPLFWDDHASNAIFFDGAQGESLCNEGVIVPLHSKEDLIPGTIDPEVRRMTRVGHRLKYLPGTRFVASAEIDMIDLQNSVRTISFEPLLRFQMKGLGYYHSRWVQGAWQGELEIGGESFDPSALDPEDPSNIHVQQVSRVSDGIRVGIGVLEHVCFGPYAPYGLNGFSDGAAS
jgi:hypothetical protein